MKNKVLITGCNGHIGRRLVSALSGDITLLCRNKSNAKSKFPVIKCDLSDEEKLGKLYLERFDVVVHLAGFVPKKGEDDHKKSVRNNVLATKNLCKFLNPDAHLIFASTCEVYGTPSYLPINESHPLNPNSNYGRSKADAEDVVKAMNKVTILRFTNVYGPGEVIKRAIPNFINAAIDNQEVTIFGDGEDKRDFLYIDDAITAIKRVIETGVKGTYNIASGHSITIKELAEKINNLSCNTAGIVFNERQKEKVDYVFDIQKAKKFFEAEVGLDEGLAKEIDFFRKGTLFIDLDGTILDVSDRLYALHKEALKGVNKTTTYSKEEYIDLKRKNKSEMEINNLSIEELKSYELYRKTMIEDEQFLNLDRVIDGVEQTLEVLGKRNRLVMVTKRKNNSNLKNQLTKLGIQNYFDEVIMVTGSKEESLKEKSSVQDVIVGDTEEDINAGKKLGLLTISVNTGSRDKDFLLGLKPDMFIECISKLCEIEEILNPNLRKINRTPT